VSWRHRPVDVFIVLGASIFEESMLMMSCTTDVNFISTMRRSVLKIIMAILEHWIN